MNLCGFRRVVFAAAKPPDVRKGMPFRQVLLLVFEAAPHVIDCKPKYVEDVRRH